MIGSPCEEGKDFKKTYGFVKRNRNSIGGNNYEARKKRAQRLLDLTYSLGIKVIETNIREGKETI